MRPRFDPTITLGNVLQIIIISSGVVGAWMNVRSNIDRHEVQINAMSRVVDKLADAQVVVAQNLAVLTATVNERSQRATIKQ